jgi:Cu(I)/Ag(I) efflux system membrane protein CusA/SilA
VDKVDGVDNVDAPADVHNVHNVHQVHSVHCVHQPPAPDLRATIDEAIYDGAVLRVRPKAMTVTTTIAGLLPIFWRGGIGSEMMTRIAAPMFGGMISAAILSMIIIPAAYKIILARRAKR